MDSTTLALGAFLLFALGKKASAATSDATGKTSDPGASLMARANQKRANDWVPTFINLMRTPQDSQAYARWSGIESGGNPMAVSPLGERGLFQCMPDTALVDRAMSARDWSATQNPQTSRAEHARIALELADLMWKKASRRIRNVPSDAESKIWYAKMWHSRPADFNGQIMHGDARSMARQLEVEWAGKPKATYRLRVANVIAFGSPTV